MGKARDLKRDIDDLVSEAATVLHDQELTHHTMCEHSLNVFTNWWPSGKTDKDRPFHVSDGMCDDHGCGRCAQGATLSGAVAVWLVDHG